MRADPAKLFVSSGLIQRGCLRGYWVAFATWVTIDLGLSPVQLVVLGTAMELTILVSEIPTGVVADVVSRRLSVIIAFAIMGSGMVLAGLTETFWVLVLSQMMWGLGWTFLSGAETAWVTDELGGAEKVERLILRRARLQFAFSIVGMVGGVILGALTSLPVTVVTAGCIMIGWAAVLSLTMTEHAFERQRGDTWSQFIATLRAGARRTKATPALRILAVVVILGAFGGEVMDRLDIRRLDQIGLPDDVDEILIVGLIASLEAVAGGLFLWRVERRQSGAGLPSAASLLMLAAATGAALLGLVAVLPIAAAGLVLQGGLRSALEPVYTGWANAHTPPETRATVHSFVGQADAGGEIVGGLTLAWVASATTVPTAMSCSMVLFAIAGLIALRGRAAWTR